MIGPFNALDVVNGRAVEITVGPHLHCSDPPLAFPADYADHVQISIQPERELVSNCVLDWFAIDLFYDPDSGTIEAIALSLFGS